MKVTAPLMGLGAAAVKIGSDFEAGMSEVRAISGYKYFNGGDRQAFKKSLTEQPMDDLAKALKVLVDRGIINTPDYWQQNARVGKTVNGAYAAALIEKVAAFLEKNPPP